MLQEIKALWIKNVFFFLNSTLVQLPTSVAKKKSKAYLFKSYIYIQDDFWYLFLFSLINFL